MAQHIVELCTILIEESFGDTARLIWSSLAGRGRTQFPDLVKLANVSTQQLAHILPILILNRTVVYYVDPDFDATWYSVDIEGTYDLLRMSRLSDIVKERCGRDAAHVVGNVAQLGHITIGELVRIYRLDSEQENGVNGTHPVVETQADTNGIQHVAPPRDVIPIKTLDQLYAALEKLIREEFLVKANPNNFHTSFDRQQSLEQSVQEEHFVSGKITGPKASALFARAVQSQKRKQREEDFVLTEMLDKAAKRQKMSNGTAGHVLSSELMASTVLSTNMRKYSMALRSRSYVRLAKHHLGDSSATVYDNLLQVLEKQLHDVHDGRINADDEDGDDDDDLYATATAANIYDIIDHATDFTSSIKVSVKDLPTGTGKGQFVQVNQDFTDIGIKQEHDSDDDGQVELNSYQNRSKIMELIERHLQSLEEHPRAFCQRKGHGKPAVWTVNFSNLTQNIILTTIDEAITARFGKTATRIVRMMREKGKMEEKQISISAYMHANDIREILSKLYAAGYVEAQELPKDSTRQPAKALYLWYFDQVRVQRMLIYQSYQSMARLFQRLAHERKRFAPLIEKMQRLAEGRFFGDNYYDATAKADEDEDVEPNPVSNGEVQDELEHSNEANGVQDTSAKPAPPIKFVLGQTGLWKHHEKLTKHEKDEMSKWRALESNFLGQIMRLDDLIMLLRDFSGFAGVWSV